MTRARALTRAALAALPADDADWRSHALAQAAYLEWHAGDLIAAERHGAEVAALADAIGNHLVTSRMFSVRGFILHDQGQLVAADAYLEHAWRVVDRLGVRAFQEVASLELLAALLRYARDDLDGAERRLDAWRASPGVDRLPGQGYVAGAILARIRAARGDFDGAYGALEDADACNRLFLPADGGRSGYAALVVPAWRARIDAARGDLDAVRSWANAAAQADLTESPLGHWGFSPISPMLVRARLLTGDPAGALEVLAGWSASAEERGAGRALLELTALEALAQEALGRREAAAGALARALALALPEGAVRPFLDEGVPMAELARRVAGRGGTGAAGARALLAAFEAGPAAREAAPAGSPGAALVEPLTERELELLGLVADGLSNEGIAERLFLSASTVKWHLRAIYGKLGAERRTDAVARARALGLLD
jgi:LuxR family maltose regulon positive regulatory protein